MSTRRTSVAAFVAAFGYLVVAAITIVKPQPNDHWNAVGRLLEAGFIVGLIGSAVAIDGVRSRVTTRALGARSARAAQAGFVGMTVASVASLIADGDTLGPLFLLSVLTTLVGLLLFGIAGLRESLTARWIPVVPFATMFIGIALADHGGCAVIAAGWVAVATALTGEAAPVRTAPAPA